MEKEKVSQIYGIEKDMVLEKISNELHLVEKEFKQRSMDVLKDAKFTYIGETLFLNSFFPPFPSKAFNRAAFHGWRGEPYMVDFAITDKCNYHCWHCYRVGRGVEDLPLKVIQKAIKEVQDAGACIIGLTGGEPLLREDLTEIASTIDSRSTVVLYTTGYGITLQKAEELKKAGVIMAIISLDHFEPEIHDKRRGYPGAYKNAINAIEVFKKVGIYVVVTIIPAGRMTISDNLWKFIEIVGRLGVHEIRIGNPVPAGRLIGRIGSLNTGQRAGIREIYTKANRSADYPVISPFTCIESTEQFGCGAGYHYASVDTDGSVAPCVTMPLSFGNIQDEGFEDIWKRMFNVFKRPGGVCYMGKIHHEIFNEMQKGAKLPLSCETSIAICKKYPRGVTEPIPKFYKGLIHAVNIPKILSP